MGVLDAVIVSAFWIFWVGIVKMLAKAHEILLSGELTSLTFKRFAFSLFWILILMHLVLLGMFIDFSCNVGENMECSENLG